LVYEVDHVWEDPSKQLETYKQLLISEENGWEFTLEDGTTKKIHYGYIDFKNEEKVNFLVDFTTKYQKLLSNDIIFSIKNRNPVLSFPKSTNFTNFIEQAKNLDSLFVFNKILNDTIFLDGQIAGSNLKLFKSTKEKVNALLKNQIDINKENLKKVFNMTRFFFQIHKRNQSYDISLDTLRKEFVIHYGTNQDYKVFISKYYFDHDGIVFNSPFLVDNLEIKKLKLKSLKLDYAEFEDEIKITNESKPKVYNPVIAKDFHGHEAGFGWGSFDGFCTRDRIDIANMKSIFEFNMYAIFPVMILQDDPPVIHGLIGFIMRNGSISLGSDYPLTTYTNDGRVIFKKYVQEDFNTSAELTKAKSILTPLLYNPQGFYIIQRNNGVYLVDARDGKTWAYLISLTRTS